MSNAIKMPKRFDYSASADFNTFLAEIFAIQGEGGEVHLDCAGMDYIDSAGIGILVMSHKKAMAKKATIVIVNAKPSIKEILMLANLQKLIEVR
jgi:anti-anti-sigma factor